MVNPVHMSRTSITATTLFTLLCAIVPVLAARAPRPIPAPLLSTYAVLGIDGASLRKDVRVDGAAGVVSGTLTLARGVRLSGAAAADTVRVAASSRANRFFCRLVIAGFGTGGGVGGPVVGGVSLPACFPFTAPLVDPVLLPAVTVVPGSADIHVPSHTGTSPTPGGNYGDVTVGKGSLLQLAGGAYTMRSIHIARSGRVVCTGECRIGVSGDVTLKRHAQLGVASSLRADKARIDIAASAGGAAFTARPFAIVAATIYAPGGDVVLAAGGNYRGAYIGKTVTVGPRSRIRGNSAL
jgi:hypothetical protein